jgi:hypothetical protein
MSVIDKQDSPQLVSRKLDHEPNFSGEIDDGEYHLYRRYVYYNSFADKFTYDLYYFENDALMFWGTFDDFKTHENTKLRKIAVQVLDKHWGEL